MVLKKGHYDMYDPQAMGQDLEKCPFCGDSAFLLRKRGNDSYFLMGCIPCQVWTKGKQLKSLTKRWNKRTTNDK